MLTVERISKVFGEPETGYPALKDISIEIAQGPRWPAPFAPRALPDAENRRAETDRGHDIGLRVIASVRVGAAVVVQAVQTMRGSSASNTVSSGSQWALSLALWLHQTDVQ
jgi:hypothetical protein